MTVRELHDTLAGLDGSLVVLLSSDAEGNRYGHVGAIDVYHAVSGRHVELLEGDDAHPVNAVCLWPED